MRASFKKYHLNFKRPSGTSRGVLHSKETWFVQLEENDSIGIGECAVFRGLSADDVPDYQAKIEWLCDSIEQNGEVALSELEAYPSIHFGVETALRSLDNDSPFIIHPSKFTEGTASIPINGLVWMGDFQFMKRQITEKIEQGFSCIKLKIGAIDFEEELSLLAAVREEFSAKDIELRVDANGAFDTTSALEKLKRLADFDLHSIEQPIKVRQWEDMAYLCEYSPLDIALDEELIGIFKAKEKKRLLATVKPQYIILKPALVGGFSGSEAWIETAEANDVKWWITSALESNIGLNAIAQWTYSLNKPMVTQGLGTGGLFTNNFDSPLEVSGGHLHYRKDTNWKFNLHI